MHEDIATGLITSPPTRGRELKFLRRGPAAGPAGSPPTRGRELKFEILRVIHTSQMSPPTRGRELKLSARLLIIWEFLVAPYAGA